MSEPKSEGPVVPETPLSNKLHKLAEDALQADVNYDPELAKKIRKEAAELRISEKDQYDIEVEERNKKLK